MGKVSDQVLANSHQARALTGLAKKDVNLFKALYFRHFVNTLQSITLCHWAFWRILRSSRIGGQTIEGGSRNVFARHKVLPAILNDSVRLFRDVLYVSCCHVYEAFL